MIVLLAVDFVDVTMTMTIAVDDSQVLDEFVLSPLCYSRCYSWYCCCYYLQFVPECPMHMLGIDHESTAIALDSHRILCMTDTSILPPSHIHSTLYRVHCITNNCSLNSLSLIYCRSYDSTVDGIQPLAAFTLNQNLISKGFVALSTEKNVSVVRKYLPWNFQWHICHSAIFCL